MHAKPYGKYIHETHTHTHADLYKYTYILHTYIIVIIFYYICSEKEAEKWMREQQNNSGQWQYTTEPGSSAHPPSPNSGMQHSSQFSNHSQNSVHLTTEAVQYNANTYRENNNVNSVQQHNSQLTPQTVSQLECVARRLEEDFVAANDDRTTNSGSPASTVSSNPQFNFTLGHKDSCSSSFSSGIGTIPNAALLGKTLVNI